MRKKIDNDYPAVLPANSCALHGDGNLALLECLAALDLLFARRCLRHPQVVLWVGVDANVLRGRRDGGCGCGGRTHFGGVVCVRGEKQQCESCNEEMSDTGEMNAGNRMGEEENGRKDVNKLPRASWGSGCFEGL